MVTGLTVVGLWLPGALFCLFYSENLHDAALRYSKSCCVELQFCDLLGKCDLSIRKKRVVEELSVFSTYKS